MNNQKTRRARALAEQWNAEFTGIMQALGDCTPSMKIHTDAPTRDAAMLWWKQPLETAPGANIWIGADEATWAAVGRRILSAAGVEGPGQAELKETYLEVLRQSLGALARGAKTHFGREVVASAGSEQEPPEDVPFGCEIAIGVGDEDLPPLAFHLSQALLDALSKDSQSDSQSHDESEGENELTGRACGTLDLLLDVEMPVSVSFGRTQVRIQDLLKLITGSIIELDRSITEPVEVVVNNCIIARGEVVVVDGNYGVRINEVMSRRERLQESRKYLLPAMSHRR